MNEVKRDLPSSQGGSQLQLQLLRHLAISPPNIQHPAYLHPHPPPCSSSASGSSYTVRIHCSVSSLFICANKPVVNSHHPHHQRHRSPLRRPFSRSEYGPFPSPLKTKLEYLNRSNHGYYTVGWGRSQPDAFGATHDSTSIKAKSVDLIASVRTVMRSMFPSSFTLHKPDWNGFGLG